MEIACKLASDFMTNQPPGGGNHWIRLKGPNGFQLDTDFQWNGGEPYIRFIIYTPQDGGGTREWPFISGSRYLTYLSPYRGQWGYFRFEIKLNNELQSNGYFRFFKWNDSEVPGFWENTLNLQNQDIIGDPETTPYFNEFHISNYDNPHPNEAGYYYTDAIRIYPGP
jgi:hypothetical protein